MSWNDIKVKIRNPNFLPEYPDADTLRKLPDNYVFDENESVKWNREKVIAHNKLANNAKKEYYDKLNTVNVAFATMVRQEIQSELDVSDKAASIIYDKAYEDGHADGYHEVVYCAQTYCEFISRILNAMKEV